MGSDKLKLLNDLVNHADAASGITVYIYGMATVKEYFAIFNEIRTSALENVGSVIDNIG